MRKFFGHLKTITKHKNMVFVHSVKAGIIWRGLLHDLSKYSPTEFLEGVRNFSDGKRSPNEASRLKVGYSAAWLHHKGRNRHHFEYWTDHNPKEHKIMPVKMPLVFVKEMFCDRVAASKIYQREAYTQHHPLEYFNRGHARAHMHPETAELLCRLLTLLSERGEAETFSYIRQLKDY